MKRSTDTTRTLDDLLGAVRQSSGYGQLCSRLNLGVDARKRLVDDLLMDRVRLIADVGDLDPGALRELEEARNRLADWPGADDACSATLPGVFRGGLGFVIGSYHMLAGDNAAAQAWFDGPDAAAFLKEHYDLEVGTLGPLKPYRVGTTSLIFRVGERQVLKILQYRYVRDRALSELLTSYKSEYGDLPCAPGVADSGHGWVLMDYVAGESLYDYIRARRDQAPDAAAGDRPGWLMPVLNPLLAALQRLGDRGISHYDLSSKNILVTPEHDVRLIDFGVNNLLSRSVLSTRALDEARTFTSDEVIGGDPQGVLSDCYSLGIIILQCLTDSDIDKESIPQHLDNLWRRHPHMATIVDDCITRDYANRALEYRDIAHTAGTGAGFIFAIIAERLKLAVAEPDRSTRGNVLRTIFNYRVFTGDYIAESLENTLYEGGHKIAWTDRSLMLTRWRSACISAFSLCFFILPLSVLSGLDDSQYLKSMRTMVGAPDVGFIEAIPGRLVCLTFTVVATVYYLNIFESIDVYLTPAGRNRKRKRLSDTVFWTRFWLRANAVCFAVPIALTFVVAPHLWPYCAFAGLVFVGFNNHFCFQAAELIRNELGSNFRTAQSSSIDDALDTFSRWDLLVFVYAIGILLLGGAGLESYRASYAAFLTEQAWPLDPIETVGAIIVCVVNIVKMLGENCIGDAPKIRTMLLRLFLTHRRVDNWDYRLEHRLSARLNAVWRAVNGGSPASLISTLIIVGDYDREAVDGAKRIEDGGVAVQWLTARQLSERTATIPDRALIIRPEDRS